jgi:hypothetical protein
MLPGCLRLAVTAAGDSDKLRPSGLQALGSLFALQARLLAEQQPAPAAAAEAGGQQLYAAAAQAVQQCLEAGNARVQWAACEAAGQLLACPAAPVQQHWPAVLQQLLALLRECPNFRSRALAAGALRQLGGGSPAAAGGSGGSIEQLLGAVADVLFQGEWVGGWVNAHNSLLQPAVSPSPDFPAPAKAAGLLTFCCCSLGVQARLLASPQQHQQVPPRHLLPQRRLPAASSSSGQSPASWAAKRSWRQRWLQQCSTSCPCYRLPAEHLPRQQAASSRQHCKTCGGWCSRRSVSCCQGWSSRSGRSQL